MSTLSPLPEAEAPSTWPASASEAAFDLVGSSPAMRRLRLQVRRIGPHFRTVLIRGEAGTEKEQVARALHSLSQGASAPFVPCHAGTLDEPSTGYPAPDNSSSLYSLLAAAQGGTLFLDGTDEMSPETQAALLRVLRWQELTAGQRKTPHGFDLRMIAGSSEDLRVQTSAGRFRQELYQRLATVEIALPSLRERLDDIAELTEAILDRMTRFHGCDPQTVSAEAMEQLLSYRWPGNMRELENVLRSASLQNETGVIGEEHLPVLAEAAAPVRFIEDVHHPIKLQDVVDRHVMRILKDCGGNKLRAAERLGISRSTLYRMLDAGAAAHLVR